MFLLFCFEIKWNCGWKTECGLRLMYSGVIIMTKRSPLSYTSVDDIAKNTLKIDN